MSNLIKWNKRGLSNVVAALSLVLITTIATVLISVQVNNVLFSSETQFNEDFSCLDLQSSLVVQMRKACYNADEGDVELTLERKVSNLNIPKLDFTINGASSESYGCADSCGNCNLLGLGNTKTYYFEAGGFDGGEAIVHIGNCVLDEIEVQESC